MVSGLVSAVDGEAHAIWSGGAIENVVESTTDIRFVMTFYHFRYHIRDVFYPRHVEELAFDGVEQVGAGVLDAKGLSSSFFYIGNGKCLVLQTSEVLLKFRVEVSVELVIGGVFLRARENDPQGF